MPSTICVAITEHCVCSKTSIICFRHGTVGVDHVIGQQHGERLVAHQFARLQHRVSQSERFFLADVGDVNHVRNLADDLQQVGLPALFEHLLEFVADVEVVFDRLLAAAGDDDDLIASRMHRLFHAILNDGLVDQRQHFFGLGLGGGKEAGAQTGGGKNSFANFHRHGVEFSTPIACAATSAANCTCALANAAGLLRQDDCRGSRCRQFFQQIVAASAEHSSAIFAFNVNFNVPSGVNCAPRCDATNRASLSGIDRPHSAGT